MLSMDVKVYVSRSGVYADIEVRLSATGAQTPPIPAAFLLLSKNGTKVNGVDIKGRGWVPLKPGDVVEVAGVIALTLTEAAEP